MLQCDRRTGQCDCIKGVTGDKCDMCDRGTTGVLPNCKPCGECFDDWDKTISILRSESNYYLLTILRITFLKEEYRSKN